MKRFVFLPLALLSFSLFASFDFKDVKGFQSCLQQKNVVLEKTQGSEKTKSLLNSNDVLIKCHENSLTLLKGEKDTSVIKKYIEVVKANYKKEEALPHVLLLVKVSSKECNPMENYEVMMAGFAHPENYPSKDYSYSKMASDLALFCLKDSEFKKDFPEELSSSSSYAKAHICKILKDQKIVSHCP